MKEWEDADCAWDVRAAIAEKKHPLKGLKRLPKMEGIAKKTKRFLKAKALFWMVKKDRGFKILKFVLKRPFYHTKNYLLSLFSKTSFQRDGDFFLYGFKDQKDFEKALKQPKTQLLLGFSYCHKPFECPSGRFTDQCMHASDNPVCQQCFIGQAMHALPSQGVTPVIIPTVHYIGQKVFEAIAAHPKKEIIFLITACEMTLTMFADWGNLAGVKGVGIRLDGRICNTMEAFSLSEEGIKPGLTVVLDPAQKQCLRWIRYKKICNFS